MMKIYDCFPFFNELELLELRLASLWDVVDYFVIVEADKTHANKPKPFNFYEHIHDYEKYLSKIHYIMDTSTVPYKGVGDWSLENNQRNSIMKGLTDAEPDDLILISDADEFPDPAIIKTIRESFTDTTKHVDLVAYYDASPFTRGKLIPFHCGIRIPTVLDLTPVSFNQIFHSYYFDWVNRDLPWTGTVIGKFKYMESPQAFRDARKGLPRIIDGGWHFSSMGGVDKFLEKVRAAPDFRNFSDVDKNFLEEAMKNGKYLVSGAKFVSCDVSEIKLPALKDFLKKYPYFVKS